MSFTVRTATTEDMPELLRLREERNAVYIQDRRLQANLLDDDTWTSMVTHWLTLDENAFLVADRSPQLIGYIIGWQQDNLPMLSPQRYGLVSEMTVDGHCKQGGVGTALFAGLRDWFRERGLTHIEVRVPHLQPIEQAFWRASGARDYLDHLWMRLD